MTSDKPAKRTPRPIAKPDRARLHEAALRHLARYAATEAGLVRVLDRRVMRWTQQGQATGEDRADDARALRPVVREVARRLVEAGAVNDEVFAGARARTLARAGRSKRAIGAHLAARGIDPALRDAALPEDDARAAAILCRKRRLGAFGPPPADPTAARKQAGVFARNGFSEALARKILGMGREALEALARGEATEE